jgi:hypothetical protein
MNLLMLLDNKFKLILDYVANPASNHHAGDKLICYLTFDAGQSIEVKRKLPNWLSLARGYGYDYATISIATVVNDFFQQNPRRRNWVTPEMEDGREVISEFFKDDLGSLIIENEVIEKAILDLQVSLLSKPKPLLIITDLEAIHPFARFGPIEQNIYSALSIPLIILYPGNINGSSLEFLGFYPQDGNYRSKHF